MSQTPVLTNPLKEGIRMEEAAEPCAVVILGANGDLTKRKLIPALYALDVEGQLPSGFCIIGMSRTKITDEEFRAAMHEGVKEFGGDIELEEKAWERFASAMYYLPGNIKEKGAFDELAKVLKDLEQKHGTRGNTIFYMSTAPTLYEASVDRIAESGLAKSHPGNRAPWPRVVVEKPFGRDLSSARALDQKLHEAFREDQIFRIDHYLGKETVQNIMALRFANGIFEPLWNRQHVDHVQITNAETIGVEGRGGYYEESGNLRDMIQNHMLQVVAMVAMEPPTSLVDDSTRDEKAKVLRSMRPIDVKNLDRYVVRGQYGSGWINGEKVPGYREEEGCSPTSKTETFSALKIFIDNWRWEGVPFYVRSGKRLAKRTTEVAITFKSAPHRIFQDSWSGAQEPLSPNVLVLQIQPDEGISLKFATKQPGNTMQLRWLSMDFKYGAAFGGRTPSAYERLIHDCILGDPMLYSRTDAVDASWKLIDPILAEWAKREPKFPNYEAGSWGPAASDELINADGRHWRNL